MRRVGAGFEEAHDEPCVTRAGGANQCGRALRVFGVEREAESRACARRLRCRRASPAAARSAGSQRAMRQFPARPVEPVRRFVFASRECEAERCFTARGGDLGARAGLDQVLQQRHGEPPMSSLTARCIGVTTERVARVRIGATREQLARKRDIAECDGAVQRGCFRRVPARTSRNRAR